MLLIAQALTCAFFGALNVRPSPHRFVNVILERYVGKVKFIFWGKVGISYTPRQGYGYTLKD
nr:MAG: hypothetical protein [Bacteriophage sp.]